MAGTESGNEARRPFFIARCYRRAKAWYAQVPPSSIAQCLSASCACLTAAAACFGVYTFFRSVSVDQLNQAELAMSRIYPLDISISQTLGKSPLMWEAIYNDSRGHTFRQLSEQEKSLFKEACGQMGDLFEYFLLIRDRMSKHPEGIKIVGAWNAYLRGVCKDSYGFRGYINANRGFWNETFLTEFDRYSAGSAFATPDELELNLSKLQRERSQTSGAGSVLVNGTD